MKINNFNASIGNAFIIAEIGNNHNGHMTCRLR